MVIAKTRYAVLTALAALGLASAPAQAAGAPSSAAPAQPEVDTGSRALTDADSYVRLSAVQTPIRHRSMVSGTLQVTLALDAPQARTRAMIHDRRIWLRDAFNETLLLYASRVYQPGDVPDADMIARLLQEDADRLLGADRAQVVLDTVIIHAG